MWKQFLAMVIFIPCITSQVLHVLGPVGSVKSDSHATLTCGPVSPQESVTWEKDGIPMQENAEEYIGLHFRQLTIKKVEPKDSGLYKCMVEQQGENISSSTYKLDVQYKFETKVAKVDASPYSADQSVKLQCVSTKLGNPDKVLLIMWFRDNVPLPHTARFEYAASTVTILNLRKADTGKYTCHIINDLSDYYSSFVCEDYHLLVKYEPSTPVIRPPTQVGSAGQEFEVTCDVQDRGFPKLNFYEWDDCSDKGCFTEQTSSPVKTYKVSSNTSIWCRAESDLFISQTSKQSFIFIKEDPEIHQVPPASVPSETSSQELVLKWSFGLVTTLLLIVTFILCYKVIQYRREHATRSPNYEDDEELGLNLNMGEEGSKVTDGGEVLGSAGPNDTVAIPTSVESAGCSVENPSVVGNPMRGETDEYVEHPIDVTENVDVEDLEGDTSVLDNRQRSEPFAPVQIPTTVEGARCQVENSKCRKW